MQETNLLELITKDKETISSYLSDVATEQFVEDVKTLLENSTDKQLCDKCGGETVSSEWYCEKCNCYGTY